MVLFDLLRLFYFTVIPQLSTNEEFVINNIDSFNSSAVLLSNLSLAATRRPVKWRGGGKQRLLQRRLQLMDQWFRNGERQHCSENQTLRDTQLRRAGKRRFQAPLR